MWRKFHEVLQFNRTKEVKLQVRASLKCFGGYMREAGTVRWQKLSYSPQMLSDDILSFEVDGGQWVC